MTPPVALIQLISEQTMQNLLPLLAFQPEALFHLATPRTASRSGVISRAAARAGVTSRAISLTLSGMPSIPETSRAVAQAIDEARTQGMTAVVNFTGGTKLMSIGGYEAARAAGVPSFYADTDGGTFLDGHTGDGLKSVLGADFSYTALQRKLTVDVIAAANGEENVTEGKDWLPYLELAAHLLANPEEEEDMWDAIHGKDGICPKGQEPREASAWLALLDVPIDLPQRVGELAIACGLVVLRGSEVFLPDRDREAFAGLLTHWDPAVYQEATSLAKSTLSFLSGGWWEVAVADAAERSGQFRDLRWSVDVGTSSRMEEDLVAVDGVSIAFFSCKRGGSKARLLPQLDEMNHRAQRLGGRFTQRFLAVYKRQARHVRAGLEERAKQVGIRLIGPDDLSSEGCFRSR